MNHRATEGEPEPRRQMRDEFHANAAAGILVLVALLLSMNAVAIWLRDRYQKRGLS